MTAVYAAVVAMALAAAAWAVYGARRHRREEPDRSRANVGVFAHRRRELAAEGEAQGLSDAERAHLEEELIANLHDEAADATGASTATRAAPGLIPVAAAALFAAAGSVGLYALWGEPDAPLLARTMQTLEDPHASEGSLEVLQDALLARLGRRPHDGASLFHLGHLQIRMRDYERAAENFSRLRALTPEPEVDAAWAQARYLADGGRVLPETRAVIDRVMASEPDQPMMLELLTMDAMQRDAPAEASRYLARLLEVTPAGPRRDLFGQALALAHERMSQGGPGAAPPEPAAATTGGVELTVSVSPDLEVSADAPVFVIARAASGGGPPYAVRRLTVAELPARLELHDGHAMVPGRHLSGLETFELVARVGVSGSPTRTTGDFESDAVTARHGEGPVALLIGKGVP